ncbi:MAG TPA: hypothetical protein PK733_04800 [Clostridiales bacterium]|nr:hypothetical protein [Clostridiales bacterium]
MRKEIKRRKQKNTNDGPVFAPGLSNDALEKRASVRDILKGNYTKVTKVYLDENDPS